MERAQLRETVKALRAEAEAEEANHTAAIEALKTAHATEVGMNWPCSLRRMDMQAMKLLNARLTGQSWKGRSLVRLTEA